MSFVSPEIPGKQCQADLDSEKRCLENTNGQKERSLLCSYLLLGVVRRVGGFDCKKHKVELLSRVQQDYLCLPFRDEADSHPELLCQYEKGVLQTSHKRKATERICGNYTKPGQPLRQHPDSKNSVASYDVLQVPRREEQADPFELQHFAFLQGSQRHSLGRVLFCDCQSSSNAVLLLPSLLNRLPNRYRHVLAR